MTPSNQQFVANLHAATALLADVQERLQWLNSFAPAAIADPETPATMIDNIDRVLGTCRETMFQLDGIVDLVRQIYVSEHGRPPGAYLLN
jgi:hypothetical protein